MMKQKTKELIRLLEKTQSNEVKWIEFIKWLKEYEKTI